VTKDIHSDPLDPAHHTVHTVVPCVGAVIRDDARRLLLIKRGHAPGLGLWSLPGGRVEAGETDEQALTRELREETGLVVTPTGFLGSVERPATDGPETGGPDAGGPDAGGPVLLIRDYTAEVTGGSLAAGDDAADARWVSAAELPSLPLTSGLVEALTSWGVL
jgi:8-oxo-dGTP diphosphatase